MYRILIPGGIMCINIGDTTKTIDNKFCLYSNHSRILTHCLSLGFDNLPNIIWRKQTNAPNKFMGSGMLPVGAYVTL
jgi:modification methylase